MHQKTISVILKYAAISVILKYGAISRAAKSQSIILYLKYNPFALKQYICKIHGFHTIAFHFDAELLQLRVTAFASFSGFSHPQIQSSSS